MIRRSGLTRLVSLGTALSITGCVTQRDVDTAVSRPEGGDYTALAGLATGLNLKVRGYQTNNPAAIDAGSLVTQYGTHYKNNDVKQELTINQTLQSTEPKEIHRDFFGPFFTATNWTDKNGNDKFDYPDEFDIRNKFSLDDEIHIYAVTKLDRPYHITFEIEGISSECSGSSEGNVDPKNSPPPQYNRLVIKGNDKAKLPARFKVKCFVDGEYLGERVIERELVRFNLRRK